MQGCMDGSVLAIVMSLEVPMMMNRTLYPHANHSGQSEQHVRMRKPSE